MTQSDGPSHNLKAAHVDKESHFFAPRLPSIPAARLEDIVKDRSTGQWDRIKVFVRDRAFPRDSECIADGPADLYPSGFVVNSRIKGPRAPWWLSACDLVECTLKRKPDSRWNGLRPTGPYGGRLLVTLARNRTGVDYVLSNDKVIPAPQEANRFTYLLGVIRRNNTQSFVDASEMANEIPRMRAKAEREALQSEIRRANPTATESEMAEEQLRRLAAVLPMYGRAEHLKEWVAELEWKAQVPGTPDTGQAYAWIFGHSGLDRYMPALEKKRGMVRVGLRVVPDGRDTGFVVYVEVPTSSEREAQLTKPSVTRDRLRVRYDPKELSTVAVDWDAAATL